MAHMMWVVRQCSLHTANTENLAAAQSERQGTAEGLEDAFHECQRVSAAAATAQEQQLGRNP